MDYHVDKKVYSGMIVNQQPASMPSGLRERSEGRQLSIQEQVLNLQNSYDSLLNSYCKDNMFDYEKHCKSLFLKAVVNQNTQGTNAQEKQLLRNQMQSVLNNKFLQFQIKEKQIIKEMQTKLKIQQELAEINHQDDIMASKINDYTTLPKASPFDMNYINQSRRKRVDPTSMNQESTSLQLPSMIQPSQRKHQKRASSLTNPTQLERPLRIGIQQPQQAVMQQEINPDFFNNRFTDDNIVKQQKLHVQQLQKTILEQQIQENRRRKELELYEEEQEKIRFQNLLERKYVKEMQQEREKSRSRNQSPSVNVEEINERPYEPINYLSNSNNIHEVMRTQPDPNDPLRNHVNVILRQSPHSNRKLSPHYEMPPAGIHSKRFSPSHHSNFQQPPISVSNLGDQNFHYTEQGSIQNQAMEFITAIKYLIQDTVQQQNLLTQQLLQYQQFPQQQQFEHPKRPVTPIPSSEQKHQDDPRFEKEAMKHTSMINTYLQEIQQLREQKDQLLTNQLDELRTNKADEVKREIRHQPTLRSQNSQKDKINDLKQLLEAKKDLEKNVDKLTRQEAVELTRTIDQKIQMAEKAIVITSESEKPIQNQSKIRIDIPVTNPDDQIIVSNRNKAQETLKKLDEDKVREEEAQKNTPKFQIQSRQQRQKQIRDEQKKRKNDYLGEIKAESQRSIPKIGTSNFDHSINYGPNGETAVKHVVHRKIDTERWDNGVILDVIDENEEHINLGKDVGISVGKRLSLDDFGADGLETNFDKPEDFKIFQESKPAELIPVLKSQDFLKPLPLMSRLMPSEYHQPQQAFAEDHREAVFGKRNLIGPDSETIEQKEMRDAIKGMEHFSIKQVIDKTMMENFDYEQRTVNQLFERYQRYKPLVSGIWGQEIVPKDSKHLMVEMNEIPQSLKEKQTSDLIKKMKDNYKPVQLAVKYDEITDNYEKVFGKKPGRIDITGEPEYPIEGQMIYKMEPPPKVVTGYDDDYSPLQTIVKPKNPEAINLGTYEVEIQEDQEYRVNQASNKPGFSFVNEKGEVLDKSVIEERILSLKVMFDDTQQLRKQKEFLNKSVHFSPGQISNKQEDDEDQLRLVKQFNVNKGLQEEKQEVSFPVNTQGSNTRMISSIIKEVKDHKKNMLMQQALQAEFDKEVMDSKVDVYRHNQDFIYINPAIKQEQELRQKQLMDNSKQDKRINKFVQMKQHETFEEMIPYIPKEDNQFEILNEIEDKNAQREDEQESLVHQIRNLSNEPSNQIKAIVTQKQNKITSILKSKEEELQIIEKSHKTPTEFQFKLPNDTEITSDKTKPIEGGVKPYSFTKAYNYISSLGDVSNPLPNKLQDPDFFDKKKNEQPSFMRRLTKEFGKEQPLKTEEHANEESIFREPDPPIEIKGLIKIDSNDELFENKQNIIEGGSIRTELTIKQLEITPIVDNSLPLENKELKKHQTFEENNFHSFRPFNQEKQSEQFVAVAPNSINNSLADKMSNATSKLKLAKLSLKSVVQPKIPSVQSHQNQSPDEALKMSAQLQRENQSALSIDQNLQSPMHQRQKFVNKRAQLNIQPIMSVQDSLKNNQQATQEEQNENNQNSKLRKAQSVGSFCTLGSVDILKQNFQNKILSKKELRIKIRTKKFEKYLEKYEFPASQRSSAQAGSNQPEGGEQINTDRYPVAAKLNGKTFTQRTFNNQLQKSISLNALDDHKLECIKRMNTIKSKPENLVKLPPLSKKPPLAKQPDKLIQLISSKLDSKNKPPERLERIQKRINCFSQNSFINELLLNSSPMKN